MDLKEISIFLIPIFVWPARTTTTQDEPNSDLEEQLEQKRKSQLRSKENGHTTISHLNKYLDL